MTEELGAAEQNARQNIIITTHEDDLVALNNVL